MNKYQIMADIFSKDSGGLKAQRWDFKKKEYFDYTLPKDSILCSNDMDFIGRCAECGQEMAYAKSYTSMRIHTSIGLGFAVCEKCYEQEKQERFNNER